VDELGAVRLVMESVDIDTPAGAFVVGMAYGQALERERQRDDDELIFREAMEAVNRHVAQHDRWARARAEAA